MAGIRKPVTLYWLRHSYATHLFGAGVDLGYVQEVLGQKSLKTTEIWGYVSEKSLQKIMSSFGNLAPGNFEIKKLNKDNK